ncbi:MAG: phospholipase D-like domain-containing protein [Flavobacteriales bacterium]|jgi:phosphatidylserine/phosphatidylglycerophosphate/cardiolipin synthase-like enzyme|nr:phospholipase D-like domain-containing protein [Flavobacteriales bacterium]
MKRRILYTIYLWSAWTTLYSQKLVPTLITPNSISFSTTIGPLTNLEYGTTKDLELGIITGNSMLNLDPATFYYVKGIASAGTTEIGLFSTQSNSTGSIEVFFNHQPNNDFSAIADAKYTNFENKIIEIINAAEVTLDLCVFYTKSKKIGAAINEANNRGVVVRFIAGSSSLGDFPKNLDENIATLKREEPKGQMHNKFIVVDVGSETTCKVLITSANFTENNLEEDSNNLLIIQDQALGKAYTLEFNEMWGSTGHTPTSNSKFGIDKTDNTPHFFNIGGKAVELYFSPSDHVEQAINDQLKTADNDLGFALFTFTRDLFAQTLLKRNNDGVDVYGVIDNKSYYGSEDNNLENGGVALLKFNRKDDMHNKYAFVDALDSNSNPLVITGSYNWSNSAEEKYDENTIIIHDAGIVNEYYEDLNTFTNFGHEKALLNNIVTYPNPSTSWIYLKNISATISDEINVQLIDGTGRILEAREINLSQAFDLSLYPIGIYYLRIMTRYNNVVKKIVKN